MGRLALPRLFGFEPIRSAVPGKPHAGKMVGDPGLAPGRLGDFKSPGSAVPAEASRREIGGHEGTCTPKAARF